MELIRATIVVRFRSRKPRLGVEEAGPPRFHRGAKWSCRIQASTSRSFRRTGRGADRARVARRAMRSLQSRRWAISQHSTLGRQRFRSECRTSVLAGNSIERRTFKRDRRTSRFDDTGRPVIEVGPTKVHDRNLCSSTRDLTYVQRGHHDLGSVTRRLGQDLAPRVDDE